QKSPARVDCDARSGTRPVGEVGAASRDAQARAFGQRSAHDLYLPAHYPCSKSNDEAQPRDLFARGYLNPMWQPNAVSFDPQQRGSSLLSPPGEIELKLVRRQAGDAKASVGANVAAGPHPTSHPADPNPQT